MGKSRRFISEQMELSDDISVVNRIFWESGWTDGFPIIPPTKKRVLQLLEGATQEADEVIAEIPPRWGEASMEKVAINAVMAGCLPQHLPILIAALQALVEERFNLFAVQATTHPCGVLLIINGPIRKRLLINCTQGAFGPGTLSNAVIGRALRLILINIGGAVPGEVDKATHGQPGKFTCVIGENEEESPWESLSIEKGFGPEQNTVTVVAAEGPHNVNDHSSSSASGILTTIAGSLACQGSNNFLYQTGGGPVVVIGPEHAATIAKDKMSKADVRQYLFEHSKLPRAAFSPEQQTKRLVNYYEKDMIPVANRAEDILVIVAGGVGKHSMVMPTFGNTVCVTRVIQ